MKNSYRERILQEKKKLDPEQVFCSPSYEKLLQSIANEIAGEKFEQLLLYKNAEDGLLGWNDGKMVAVNLANRITETFPEMELKSTSLIGILGHECGHARFTDCTLRKEYINRLLRGNWYPSAPEPEENEKADLEELTAYLERKSQLLLPLLVQSAGYLSNLLNDVYIEGEMCSRYPGSIKRGLLLNRKRNTEGIPTLLELLENGNDPVTILLNLCAQYALTGRVNSWNQEKSELLDVLKKLMPIIDQAKNAPTDLKRYQATNQILLKMWKYFREILGSMEEKEEGSEDAQEKPEELQEANDKEESGESSTELKETEEAEESDESGASGKTTEEGSQENKDVKKREDSNATKERKTQTGSMDFATASDAKEETQEMKEAIQRYLLQQFENLPKFLTEQEKTETKFTILSVSDLGNTDETESVSNQEPSVKDASDDADLALQEILYQLAKEQAEKEMNLETREALQMELNSVEFDGDHQKVQKKICRESAFTEADQVKLKTYENAIQRTVRRLQVRLLPILENQKERTEHRMFLGKRLDMRNLTEQKGAIYKRSVPGKKTDAAVAVLIDNSGSMNGERLEISKLAALCLYDFCQKAKIPICIYGHCTDGWEHTNLEEEIVYLRSCAEFEPEKNDRLRIIHLKAEGRNRDGAALWYLGNQLLLRPEKHKLLFLISDGLPNSNYYAGGQAMEDLKQIKNKLVKKGIVFQAAAIGCDKEQIRQIYGNAYLDISDLEQLPKILTRQIAKLLRRNG